MLRPCSHIISLCLPVTEHMGTDEVILNCSVVTYGQCHHTVNWLLKGQDVNKDNKEILTSQTDCSTTVTFWKSHYIYPSRYENMKCEVTDAKTGSVQLFTFSYQSSDEETGELMISCLKQVKIAKILIRCISGVWAK